MAYASPATYIFFRTTPTQISIKTTTTYIVFNHSDITSKSNYSEYIFFRTQTDVQNETGVTRLGTIAP